MSLSSLGWNDTFAALFLPHSAAGLVPARVARQHKHAYELLAADGDLTAACTGRLLHESVRPAALPAVGDWVGARLRPGERQADIHVVLPRRTVFSRQAPGAPAAEQVLAANIDTAFLVTALDQNYNLRRIERHLTVARQSGAQPVVVLNKTDLHADPASALAEVSAVAGGAPVLAVSALAERTLAPLAPWLAPGSTVALLGSSGVGKSTLVNALLGEALQPTGPVSAAVGKGRHTTTRRELILAPAGFLLMDTPGLRELQLWGTTDEAVDETFADVHALAARCRFSDCSHRREPGCAVRAALDDGTLDDARWESFQKLQREQAYAALKSDARLAREHTARWKKIALHQRAADRFRGDD